MLAPYLVAVCMLQVACPQLHPCTALIAVLTSSATGVILWSLMCLCHDLVIYILMLSGLAAHALYNMVACGLAHTYIRHGCPLCGAAESPPLCCAQAELCGV